LSDPPLLVAPLPEPPLVEPPLLEPPLVPADPPLEAGVLPVDSLPEHPNRNDAQNRKDTDEGVWRIVLVCGEMDAILTIQHAEREVQAIFEQFRGNGVGHTTTPYCRRGCRGGWCGTPAVAPRPAA
jgi:hypothetical protein